MARFYTDMSRADLIEEILSLKSQLKYKHSMEIRIVDDIRLEDHPDRPDTIMVAHKNILTSISRSKSIQSLFDTLFSRDLIA